MLTHYQPQSKLDVETTIYAAFREIEQDMMSEATFKHQCQDLIAEQQDSYTILLRLWEEHQYITVVRQPGKPRAIALGPVYERNFPCLM